MRVPAVTGLEVTAARLDDPEVAELVDQVQAEYVARYGGRDEAPTDPAEFAPPRGLFLLARLDGVAVGCGGWRSLDDADGRPGGGGPVEIKRMFTVESARRRGIGRALLTELERTAAAAGHDRVVLETGLRQPEALGFYAAAGYAPIDGFGHYAGRPLSRAFAKSLR